MRCIRERAIITSKESDFFMRFKKPLVCPYSGKFSLKIYVFYELKILKAYIVFEEKIIKDDQKVSKNFKMEF